MWGDKEKKESQPVGKVEGKKEEVEPIETKVEEAESSNGKAKKEKMIASV